MKDVQSYFKGFRVGSPGTYENLTLYSIYSEEEPVTEFLMLDEALAKGAVTISEVSESGRVSELKVKNKGDVAILLLDGEELVGIDRDDFDILDKVVIESWG